MNYVDDRVILELGLHKAATAHRGWSLLTARFERLPVSVVLAKTNQLYSLQLEEGGDLHEYIDTVMGLSDELASAGRPLQDVYLAACLLKGLPSSFDALRFNLEENPYLSYEIVKNRLLQELSRRTLGTDVKALDTSHSQIL